MTLEPWQPAGVCGTTSGMRAPRVLATSATLATFAFASFVAEPAARADQCELVTRDQAEQAAKIVRDSPGRVVAAFCAPCGDASPTRLSKQTVEVKKSGSDFALFINGKEVDLAYIYYPVGNDKYRDLAMATTCAVQQVPELVTMAQASPETEVNQLIDAQVKDPFQSGPALYTDDAVVVANTTSPFPAEHFKLLALVGANSPSEAHPVVSDRAVTFSRDHASAWIDLTLKVTIPQHGGHAEIWRITEIAVDTGSGWRVAAMAWTAPVADAVADKAAGQDGAKPALDQLDGGGDDGLRAAFKKLVDTGFGDAGHVAAGVVAIGTAPGERSSGPGFAKAWNAAWAKRLDVTGVTAGLSPSATTGWVIANTHLRKHSGKTDITVPVRLFFVFDKDASGAWQLAHAHFAVPVPG